MNLVSCEQCRVVLDKNNLEFPDLSMNHNTGELIISEDCLYDEDLCTYVVFANCPVCRNKIKEGS